MINEDKKEDEIDDDEKQPKASIKVPDIKKAPTLKVNNISDSFSNSKSDKNNTKSDKDKNNSKSGQKKTSTRSDSIDNMSSLGVVKRKSSEIHFLKNSIENFDIDSKQSLPKKVRKNTIFGKSSIIGVLDEIDLKGAR